MMINEWEALRARLWGWQRAYFGRPSIRVLALGVVEEVGELAHAIVKHEQGVRGLGQEKAFKAAAADAIGDIWIWAAQAVSACEVKWGVRAEGLVVVRGDRSEVGISMLAMSAARFLNAAEQWLSVTEEGDTLFPELFAVARGFDIDPEEAIRATAEQVLARRPGHPAIPEESAVAELERAWGKK